MEKDEWESVKGQSVNHWRDLSKLSPEELKGVLTEKGKEAMSQEELGDFSRQQWQKLETIFPDSLKKALNLTIIDEFSIVDQVKLAKAYNRLGKEKG